MPIRRALLAVLATAVGLVLLLSFKPHDVSQAAQPPAALGQKQSGTTPTQGTTGTKGTKGTAGTTVTGDPADTRWGPVQVAITVSGGKIADVQVLQAPDGNRRDIEINDAALPILTQEALSAQSAQIDTVSGATYTSEGYARSLQSAIDRAGL
ncbi:FMN-binding protein [Nonomuraea angiospora]|uniref:FMN-binding protein n=1 Tax=Nonomuraea angiospora TaxID=46172 RepID=UPI0029AB5CDB|nr:FMN-binding protein [Nonomuraea angiospora]MDX3099914.1 FMN-binding protein [Nonomuraea angiospora]